MATSQTGLFKYLDESKLDFFEKSMVFLTPPCHLNDPWDFRPKGRFSNAMSSAVSCATSRAEIEPFVVLNVE